MKIDREKLAGVVILVIVTALLYGFFMTPHGRQLKAVRSQCISGKELLEAREAKKEKLESLRKGNREWKEKLRAVENRFFTVDEVSLFLKNLARSAEKTGITLRAIDPLGEEPPLEAGIGKKMVKIAITGEYASIIKFLNVLAADKKLLGITEVKIRRTRDESQALQASFTLTLFIVYLGHA